MSTDLPSLPQRTNVMGELRVTVDAVTGTMTFDPVASGPAPGVNAQIYGEQGVTIRLFNNAPSVVTTTVKTLTANIGIKNLRPHPIGDEQGTAAPPDTMGIYIFFTSEPVITATSGACTGGCFVRVKNHDGTASFDQPSQKYFYNEERIRAFGDAAGDTSRTRKPWVFEMSPQVTNFQFSVLVSAAWPAPHETRWRLSYDATALPDTGLGKPRWRKLVNGNGGTSVITGTPVVLNLQGNRNHNVKYFRRDSVSPSGNAYIEGRLEIPSGNSSPKAVIGIADGTRVLALGIGSGQAGIVNTNDDYIAGTTFSGIGSGMHTYQLRKYAADSAVWYLDGVRRGKVLYAAASADADPSSPLLYFGTSITGNGLNSNWSSVIYEIGVASP